MKCPWNEANKKKYQMFTLIADRENLMQSFLWISHFISVFPCSVQKEQWSSMDESQHNPKIEFLTFHFVAKQTTENLFFALNLFFYVSSCCKGKTKPDIFSGKRQLPHRPPKNQSDPRTVSVFTKNSSLVVVQLILENGNLQPAIQP